MPEFEETQITVRAASTRPVQLTTGEHVRFAPEALAGIIEQVRANFIPMNYEHLSLLPPLGRFYDGSIQHTDDGHSELLLYGKFLTHYSATGETDDPFRRTQLAEAPQPTIAPELRAEPRNFTDADWKFARDSAPLPLRETTKWASLPPLEWLLYIPVTWAAVRFAGSFFDQLGTQAAQALISWVRDVSRRAKQSNRTRYLTLEFGLPDGRSVMGFLPFDPDDDHLESVNHGLRSASALAEVAGAQAAGVTQHAHRIAYLFDGNDWQLAWFVTDDGAFRTKYYDDHAPIIEKYLGSPPAPLDGGSPTRSTELDP